MELIPVKTTDPYYAEAERLMTDAFPPEERRPWTDNVNTPTTIRFSTLRSL